MDLQIIYERYRINFESEIKNCDKCSLKDSGYTLQRMRLSSDPFLVMFIGEAPGETEVRTKEAFTGKAGKLLDQWIEILGIKSYIISNIVKHRPEKDGKDIPPTLEQIERCFPYLQNEISFFDPDIIITLGKSSLYLLYSQDRYSYLRDKLMRDIIHESLQSDFLNDNIPVIPLYHPSYVLRSGYDMNPLLDRVKERITHYRPDTFKNTSVL